MGPPCQVLGVGPTPLAQLMSQPFDDRQTDKWLLAQKGTSYPELMRRKRNLQEKKRMHAKKDNMVSMQQTVRELEKRYEALCALAAARRSHEPLKQEESQEESLQQVKPVTISPIVQQSCGDSRSTSTPSLYEMVQEIHFLIRENAHLRERIEQSLHFEHLVREMTEERRLEKAFTSTLQVDHFGKFCYVPFSTEDCYAIIRKDLAEKVAKKPDFVDPSINEQLPFGWLGCVEIEQYENTNWMQARSQMTKIWPGTPEINCETMWKFDIMETDPSNVYWEQHRLEILQHVSDDIKIMRRRVAWQDWTTWSVFMVYRMCLSESYLIGAVPLPLWGNGNPKGVSDAHGKSFLDERETVLVRPVHHLFVPVTTNNSNNTKQVQTRLYRWGTAACDQAMFMPLFQQGAIESILRYEQLILCPAVKNLTNE